jgi:phosphoenolpyruvate carboxylase
MSTQHPDNVTVPAWSKGEVIDGDAEIFEAYFAYETLGCQEVMWDSEGKDADTRVVRKLLDKYGEYFREHIIGKDVFLTYRIPNPRVEVVEKKVVVETLQNIPVAYDVASSFYKRDVTPIFEVILPFTTDGKEPIWLFNYYKNSIAADEEVMIDEALRVRDWVGSFRPKRIQVIPLIEDFDSLLTADHIVEPYVEAVKPRHLRVFIARSDPALNYGLFCAVLLTKIALSKLKKLEQNHKVAIHPIIGVGSKPFRGSLSPENVDNFLREYRGLSTVTIQSAFRYDYGIGQVKESVRLLTEKLPSREPVTIENHEVETLLSVMKKCRLKYEATVEGLAPLVNSIAAYVPQRRARKLHIGLFGYSRKIAGMSLPRAIPFASSLYSIGISPEFIGASVLGNLSDEEMSLLQEHYVNMKLDLGVAGGYVSWKNIGMLTECLDRVAERAAMSGAKLKGALTKIREDLRVVEENLGIKLGPKSSVERRHENFTNNFLIAYMEREDEEAKKALVEAAKLRKCLG